MKINQALILLMGSSLVLGDLQMSGQASGQSRQALAQRRLLQTPSSCACVCGGVHEGYVQGVRPLICTNYADKCYLCLHMLQLKQLMMRRFSSLLSHVFHALISIRNLSWQAKYRTVYSNMMRKQEVHHLRAVAGGE